MEKEKIKKIMPDVEKLLDDMEEGECEDVEIDGERVMVCKEKKSFSVMFEWRYGNNSDVVSFLFNINSYI